MAQHDLPVFKTVDRTQQEVTIEEALRLAQGHHTRGNLILAERTYRDILRTDPVHFPTTHLLGVLLFQNGGFEEAASYMKLALEAKPDNVHCLTNYGGVQAQLGNYEAAIECYDQALEIKPDLIDCLNNKAYALWSLERYKDAVAICDEVLAQDSKNVLALNNKAMALAKIVRYDEALEAWETASEINPEAAIIWSNWGNALREMGRLGQAQEKCEKALKLVEDNPEALNNLACALRDLGKTDDAIHYFEQATNAKPDYADAHFNKAIAYADKREYGSAVVAARYALAFKEDLVEAYDPLVASLCEVGEYNEAHHYAMAAVRLAPERYESYLGLANVLMYFEQYDDAEASLTEALKHEPESARAFMLLSDLRERAHDVYGALDAIEEGLKISPNLLPLMVLKSTIYLRNNRAEKALDYINEAVEKYPNNPTVLVQKSEVLISMNRNDEALEILNDLIVTNGDLPSIYFNLFNIRKIETEEDEALQKFLSLEKDVKKYGKHAQTNYYFTLSEVYEKLKQYDVAFDYLERANTIRRSTVPDERIGRTWSAEVIANAYKPQMLELFNEEKNKSDVPIFIVGMPRSGTTLTEQIISSHPDVYGAGELPFWGQIFGNPEYITAEFVKDVGDKYVEQVKRLDESGAAKHITDKMPGNFANIGFIRMILPNAKIIHCRRNPIDTCLSCYKQNFQGQNFSYDQEDLADEYQRYEKIMQFWREALPEGSFLEINYEDTVNNFEEQARKLIDYVGLEWDDACLEPHKQKRTVLTASKAQVTKPVYKTSVEKWRRYEKQLQPLVRRLMPDQALPEDENSEE